MVATMVVFKQVNKGDPCRYGKGTVAVKSNIHGFLVLTPEKSSNIGHL